MISSVSPSVSAVRSALAPLYLNGSTATQNSSIPAGPAASASVGACSAALNSSALANRSAGVLASTRTSVASSAGGTVSRRVETRGTGSRKRLAMIACAVGPV